MHIHHTKKERYRGLSGAEIEEDGTLQRVI